MSDIDSFSLKRRRFRVSVDSTPEILHHRLKVRRFLDEQGVMSRSITKCKFLFSFLISNCLFSATVPGCDCHLCDRLFGIFDSSPLKKWRKEYDALLTRAFQAQRNGNIRLYSDLTAQAEALKVKIDHEMSASTV